MDERTVRDVLAAVRLPRLHEVAEVRGSVTRRKGKGRWRFIRDGADLQIVVRVRAWLADLRELRKPTEYGQNPPTASSPTFRPSRASVPWLPPAT
ncbi:hypothetical protein GCM10010330_80160 [Streptomyces tendae]|nr:hypothetical protein GCM10010330_80160 [Streptomyces tendae]